jgi:iron transport multicopper oxidase
MVNYFIQVCEGDTVIVNVKNHLAGGVGTSIHWHGILQNGSQHMDGVAMVTQCPIPEGASFQYRYI